MMPSIPLSQLFFTLIFSGPNRYKDDQLIKANDCYDLDPERYRIIIRDVRPKHAGNFTLYLSNPKHGLYKNLTIQLVVLGKSLASSTSLWVQGQAKCEAEGPHIELAYGPRTNIQGWYCSGWYYKIIDFYRYFYHNCHSYHHYSSARLDQQQNSEHSKNSIQLIAYDSITAKRTFEGPSVMGMEEIVWFGNRKLLTSASPFLTFPNFPPNVHLDRLYGWFLQKEFSNYSWKTEFHPVELLLERA